MSQNQESITYHINQRLVTFIKQHDLNAICAYESRLLLQIMRQSIVLMSRALAGSMHPDNLFQPRHDNLHLAEERMNHIVTDALHGAAANNLDEILATQYRHIPVAKRHHLANILILQSIKHELIQPERVYA